MELRGVALHLLELYLLGREQCAFGSKHNIEISMSQFSSIKKGVSQGSILEPLLLIYLFIQTSPIKLHI